MATAPSIAPSLRIKRIFQAPREKVFAAWTDKDLVQQWRLRASPEITTKHLECDVREGGNHVIEVRLPNGAYQVNRSIYKTVRPPERLVFTYEWEQFDAANNRTGEMKGTLVTVDFYERGNGTEVVLLHEFFPNQSQCDSHNGGWNTVFGLLEKLLAV